MDDRCQAPTIGHVKPSNNSVYIERVANGFIVRIGFNIFVSKEWTEVSQRLKEYFDHPIEAEKKYS